MAPAIEQRLPFSLWRQEQSQWCWAAVTSATANYFAKRERFTQCSFASLLLGVTCCAAGSQCNTTQSLRVSLARSDNLEQFRNGVLDPVTLNRELAGQRPVCGRIEWSNSGGRGHFVVISGSVATGPDTFLVVEDPYWGTAQVERTKFISAYRGRGAWTHSYTTRATANI